MKKKTVEIPQAIYTDQFLRFVSIYANRFIANNGFGRWLVEYQQMKKRGWFKPEKLREQYINILNGTFAYSYIVKSAIYSICVQALDVTNVLISSNSYEIRIITGEIAVNDDDEELTGLSMSEALSICKAMNDEAEELLFRVYNSNTNKPVK